MKRVEFAFGDRYADGRSNTETEIFEFDDDTTEEEINKEFHIWLSNFDIGWRYLDE